MKKFRTIYFYPESMSISQKNDRVSQIRAGYLDNGYEAEVHEYYINENRQAAEGTDLGRRLMKCGYNHAFISGCLGEFYVSLAHEVHDVRHMDISLFLFSDDYQLEKKIKDAVADYENRKNKIMPVKKVKCPICEAESWPKVEGTALVGRSLMTGPDVHRDFMNCPACGSQILLGPRYFSDVEESK